jgi:hypothetical protein
MIPQFLEDFCFPDKAAFAMLPSPRIVAFRLKVFDCAWGIINAPAILGNVGLSKCATAENLHKFVPPV